MATSTEDVLRGFGGSTWEESTRIIYGNLTGKGEAAKYIAEHLPFGPRQAQRIAVGAGVSDAGEKRSGAKYKEHLKALAVATTIAKWRKINVGTVEIAYEGTSQGTRDITAVYNPDLSAVIAALEKNDWETAAEEFEQEVLTIYGMTHGEMSIIDWRDEVTGEE